MIFRTTFRLFLIIVLLLFSLYVYLRYFSDRSIKRSESPNDVIVSTNVGSFVGSKLEYENKEILTFLGIAYAIPPVGRLRFKRPVATASNSSHVFEAKRWPNPCLQKDNHLQLKNYNFSEDCLYLNIWSPEVEVGHPVVVVVHTGAHLFGSASESTYNGLVLSALADVVVITFNYRLNIYGFLYADHIPGVDSNVGLHDQVLALEWVSHNIENFGGDPKRVTLVGQSTGAQSIGHHMLSPLSGHLFKKAVLFSGSPLQQTWLSDKTIAKRFWSKYTEEVDCSDIDKQISQTSLDCLSRLNRNSLPSMTDCKRYSEDPFVVSVPVVTDNYFKVHRPMKRLKNSNISLLFGFTSDEGSWLLALDRPDRFGPNIAQNMSWFEAKQLMRALLSRVRSNTDQKLNVEEIANHYFDSIPVHQRSDKNLMSRTIGTALGDFHISCPTSLFADYLFKNDNSSSIYQYFWTYKGYGRTSSFWKTFEQVWCGPWMGSCHSFELYSLFGLPFQQRLAFNDMDRLVSTKIIRIVANFVHNGKPTITNEWKSFERSSGHYVKPYHRIDSDLSLDHMFGSDLKSIECQTLWKNYIAGDGIQ